MTIVEISNLLNTITALHPNLSSYHFGWPSDINRNVANNYDADQQTGTLFPHVQWAAPAQGSIDIIQGNEDLEMTLHFYDLMLRDSSGATTTATMIEHWRNLRKWAYEFLRDLNRAGKTLAPLRKGIQIRNNTVRWITDAHRENDNLILLTVQFTLANKLDCEASKVDFTNPPSGHAWPPADTDIENTYS